MHVPVLGFVAARHDVDRLALQGTCTAAPLSASHRCARANQGEGARQAQLKVGAEATSILARSFIDISLNLSSPSSSSFTVMDSLDPEIQSVSAPTSTSSVLR